jgi:hypothetical protein
MPTFRNRLARGIRRATHIPAAAEDRLDRVEWLQRMVLPVVVAYPLQSLARILLGPTHAGSIHSAQIGLAGYLLALAILAVANLGARRPGDPLPGEDDR